MPDMIPKTYHMCNRYAIDVPQTCPRYATNIPQKFSGCTTGLPSTHYRHAIGKPQASHRQAIGKPQIHYVQKYHRLMPQVSHRQPQIYYLYIYHRQIRSSYAIDVSQICHRHTRQTCHRYTICRYCKGTPQTCHRHAIDVRWICQRNALPYASRHNRYTKDMPRMFHRGLLHI